MGFPLQRLVPGRHNVILSGQPCENRLFRRESLLLGIRAIFVHFRKYNMSVFIAFRWHANKGHGQPCAQSHTAVYRNEPKGE